MNDDKKKQDSGWSNLNGMSDNEDVCELSNMNCEKEDSKESSSLLDMNAFNDKKNLVCSLDNMNCREEDDK